MDQEAVHTNELEKMMEEHAEAAAQELSRKKIETIEAREKNEVPETQRNKKKSEACQEDVEKIKMKNHNKDEELSMRKKRSRSNEDRVERDEKKRRQLKAESVSLESISDTDRQTLLRCHIIMRGLRLRGDRSSPVLRSEEESVLKSCELKKNQPFLERWANCLHGQRH